MHEGSQRLTKGLSSVVFSLSPFQTEGFPFSFPVQGLNLSDSKAFKSPFFLRLHPPKAAVLAPRGLRCRDRLLDSRRSGSLVSGNRHPRPRPTWPPLERTNRRVSESLGEVRWCRSAWVRLLRASKRPRWLASFLAVSLCVCVCHPFIHLVDRFGKPKEEVGFKKKEMHFSQKEDGSGSSLLTRTCAAQ